jgi:hypothetical protein
MQRFVSWLILIAFLSGTATVLADEMMTLIGPNAEAPVIVVAADCLPSERYAAEELSTYLEKVADVAVPVIEDTATRAREANTIAVGRSALTDSIDVVALGIEQYVIDVQADRIFIVGGRRAASPGKPQRDAGTLYGVYEFLESLGVRWYRPEAWGEHVPTRERIILKVAKTVSRNPDFMMRSTLSGGMSYSREETREDTERARIWAVRNRTNAGFTRPADAVQFGGLEEHSMGRHNWPFLIPAKDYFEEHPEYFALVDGERVPYDLCPGNPEVQRIIGDKIIAQAKENPNRSSYSVEPSDARGGSCECSLCKALDGAKNPHIGGTWSNRVSAFGDIIAERVEKEAPWLKIQWLAYSNHTGAPTNLEKLTPNTLIMLCPINGWDDWRSPLFDTSNRHNTMFVRMAKDWSALEPAGLMTFLYYNGYGWPGPLPVSRILADRLQGYRTLGIVGNYLPSAVSWGPAGLAYYMYTKLSWNPDLDVDAELNLYYKNYYGPAAGPMKAYHERLMKALAEHPHHVFSGGRGMHLMFTPALVEELGGYMDEAQALVTGEPLYERRLYGVWAGYEFSRRISALLSLKKKTGELSVKVPVGEEVERPPDLARPAFRGGGSYYQSDEAEESYRELIRWMRSVNAEDPVFDMAMNFKDDAANFIYAKRGQNFGATFLSYLPSDVLVSSHQGVREEVLLKDF